jgi:hypothetical protein
LEKASREELIKKYLAVRAHFDNKKSTSSNDSAANATREGRSRGTDGVPPGKMSAQKVPLPERERGGVNDHMTDQLKEEMKSERYREWQKKVHQLDL